MRLNWNGEEILRKALTAFKLTLKEDMMPNLLKEVKDIILGGANLSKMLSLTEALFKDFSMKWLGIDLGSLVFIFEHKSEEDCKKTLEGQMCRVRRERIIDVLFTFLPSWVPRDYRLWDVSKYTLTDKDFLAWQSYPVSFYQGEITVYLYRTSDKYYQDICKLPVPFLIHMISIEQETNIHRKKRQLLLLRYKLISLLRAD